MPKMLQLIYSKKKGLNPLTSNHVSCLSERHQPKYLLHLIMDIRITNSTSITTEY